LSGLSKRRIFSEPDARQVAQKSTYLRKLKRKFWRSTPNLIQTRFRSDFRGFFGIEVKGHNAMPLVNAVVSP
jgi:hypothetical protein